MELLTLPIFLIVFVSLQLMIHFLLIYWILSLKQYLSWRQTQQIVERVSIVCSSVRKVGDHGMNCHIIIKSVQVVDVSDVVTVINISVPRHGVPVSPGVGHVVDQLEDEGEGRCQQEEGSRGRESRSEAQEPDCTSEPCGQLDNEILTLNIKQSYNSVLPSPS